MKKLFTLLFITTFTTTSFAQRILVEDFNYTAGQLTDGSGGANVSGSNWVYFSGTGNYLQVTPGSLTYPNYYTNPTPTSNKVTLTSSTASSEDAFTNFLAPVTSGTVYTSFLLQMNSVDNLGNSTSNGEYFMAYFPSTSTSAYTARVYARQGTTPNTFQLGISGQSSANTPIGWINTDLPINNVHFVTFAFQFVDGALNDAVKLWVNQPFSSTEPAAMASGTYSVGTEPSDIGRLALRQGTTLTPNANIDAIVVSVTYAGASLPLSLAGFKASLNDQNVQLSWEALNEQNVRGFEVERSNNGSSFTTIGNVAAANTTKSAYSFVDNAPLSGAGYYRLRMIDMDGSVKFSSVVVVNNRRSVSAQIFPNPTRGALSVNHPKATKGAAIQIVSAEGRQVKTFKVASGTLQTNINVSELTNGNYLLIFDNDGTKSITKFVKN